MTQSKHPPSTRWAVASLALSMLLSSLGVSIANVALPTLTQAFGASFASVQWVVLAYLLAMTVTIVNAGRLADVIGDRPMVLFGLALFTAASFLCGIAPSLPLLVAARALQGIGAAVLMALTVAYVRETVPKEKTGSAMGLLGTTSAIGTAIGPSLGGVLIAGSGWRAIFFAMVLIGVLTVGLAAHFLPRSGAGKADGARSFDVVGALLLGVTLGTYALAMTVGGHGFGHRKIALLTGAVVVGCIFILTQFRKDSPLIPVKAFRDPLLSASLAMSTLVATVMMATLIVGPFYLARALGLNEAYVGLVMSIGPAISALTGAPAGRLVDRAGAPLVIAVGLTAMGFGAFALAVLPGMFGVAGYIAAIAILTPGYQLFQASNNTAVMMDVTPDRKGVVSGLLGLSRNLGLITGASVMGAVFAFVAGTTDVATADPTAVATGMQFTFAVAAGLIVIALAIAAGSRLLAARLEPVSG